MPTDSEERWLRVLGTMNEYQARLLVAERAAELGRGGISHLSRLTSASVVVSSTHDFGGGKSSERVAPPTKRISTWSTSPLVSVVSSIDSTIGRQRRNRIMVAAQVSRCGVVCREPRHANRVLA